MADPRLQNTDNRAIVIPIVPTPFDEDGTISMSDVPVLVEYYRTCGVSGLTILGVMGEANKLSTSERLAVISAFQAECGSDLPLIVGVSDVSLMSSVELSISAMELGISGVMLQPMPGLNDGRPVVEYFQQFVRLTEGKVPVCVQDYPQNGGVATTTATWAEISRLEPVFMLKHEPPAGLTKLSAIRSDEDSNKAKRVPILTSNNAMHLCEELYRGADGAMVGVALTDLIVRICNLFRAGEREKANDIYDALLPVVRHETQGAFGLAIRKEILARRAGIKGKFLRYPSIALGETDLAELDRLLSRLERALAAIDELPDLPLTGTRH